MTSGRCHLRASHAERRTTSGTHSTLTLLAPLGSVALQAANHQTSNNLCKTQQFTCNFAASLAASTSPGKWHSQHPHAFRRLFGTVARDAFDGHIPRLVNKRQNLHDILPLTLALVARGASSGRWHSQHPHAFRASSHRRAAGRQPADTPPLAQNTAIYMQLCSIARCGASSGRWHSQHPHAFGASLELSLCRAPTSRHDNTGTKHCNLQANVQNRLAHFAWGAASGKWHSQHPHAFWRLFGTAARAAFD